MSDDTNIREELERERMRLAGCGVAAMMNTEESIKERITPDNPYWSASYSDVCNAVDREMKLRQQNEILKADYDKLNIESNKWLNEMIFYRDKFVQSDKQNEILKRAVEKVAPYLYTQSIFGVGVEEYEAVCKALADCEKVK